MWGVSPHLGEVPHASGRAGLVCAGLLRRKHLFYSGLVWSRTCVQQPRVVQRRVSYVETAKRTSARFEQLRPHGLRDSDEYIRTNLFRRRFSARAAVPGGVPLGPAEPEGGGANLARISLGCGCAHRVLVLVKGLVRGGGVSP